MAFPALALLARPTVILGVLLALSLAGNVGLYKLHTRDLQKIGGLKQETKDALATARACSKGVERLRAAAAERERRVAEALRDATARAREANERADRTLLERPAGADSCASALELNRRKIRERQQ